MRNKLQVNEVGLTGVPARHTDALTELPGLQLGINIPHMFSAVRTGYVI